MMQRTRDVKVGGVLMFVRAMPASSLRDGPSEHRALVLADWDFQYNPFKDFCIP